MASEVDIANLALAHLGDRAAVTGFDPPEGSAQAEHCFRFYPMARDALLEMVTWNFATRRTDGEALEDAPATGWRYAYAKPNNALNVFAVLPPGAQDDYTTQLPGGTVTLADGSLQSPAQGVSLTQTQPYAMETDADGDEIIVTNQADAVIRWVARITDSTKFSPLFTVALSRLLASYLAGPVLKGEAGRAESKAQYQMFLAELAKAVKSDANQRLISPQHIVPWVAAR